MSREGPCPVETELKECRDKIKRNNTPKNRKVGEVRRTQEKTQVEQLEVELKDI